MQRKVIDAQFDPNAIHDNSSHQNDKSGGRHGKSKRKRCGLDLSLVSASSSSSDDGAESNDALMGKKERTNSFVESEEDDSDSAQPVKKPLKNNTFLSLGVAQWLIRACASLGIYTPTPVQLQCIPPILAGKNVLGAAQTGSGKTAAFLLPILQRLAEDPFGIFALVLTPTRELAFQISQQVQAFGASLPVRQCTVVGGVDMTTQSNQLDRLPHIVVATPGRLADLIQGSRPPRLKKVRFLVMDEADRLFDRSFAPDLHVILTALPEGSRRQTLLFSATMDKNIQQMEELGGDDLFKWKATQNSVVVETLDQRYLFMPEQVRPAYLYKLIDKLGPLNDDEDPDDEKNMTYDDNGAFVPRMRSMIIFVQRCSDCQLIYETLLNLDFSAVALHSRLSQRRRLAALGKFKDSIVRILVATDVASRGLDIPDVDMVVNYDIPRSVEAYVHRVGRTARAGRGGTSVSMITQYDVELVKAIESSTGSQMSAFPHVNEEEILPVLNRVSTAVRTAKLNMHQTGFDERVQKLRERSKKSRKRSSNFIAGKIREGKKKQRKKKTRL